MSIVYHFSIIAMASPKWNTNYRIVPPNMSPEQVRLQIEAEYGNYTPQKKKMSMNFFKWIFILSIVMALLLSTWVIFNPKYELKPGENHTFTLSPSNLASMDQFSEIVLSKYELSDIKKKISYV